jgi:hypothetical protein
MFVATLSDFFRHRYAFTMIGMLIGIAGYGVLLSIRDTAHHTIQYGALFMITCGCFSASPVFLCWFGMNLGGHTRRSVGTAFQIGFGNSMSSRFAVDFISFSFFSFACFGLKEGTEDA